jgi:hypothetical protein
MAPAASWVRCWLGWPAGAWLSAGCCGAPTPALVRFN